MPYQNTRVFICSPVFDFLSVSTPLLILKEMIINIITRVSVSVTEIETESNSSNVSKGDTHLFIYYIYIAIYHRKFGLIDKRKRSSLMKKSFLCLRFPDFFSKEKMRV